MTNNSKQRNQRASLYRRHKAFSELMGARVSVLSTLMAFVGSALFALTALVAIVRHSESIAAVAVLLAFVGWLPTYLDIRNFPED